MPMSSHVSAASIHLCSQAPLSEDLASLKDVELLKKRPDGKDLEKILYMKQVQLVAFYALVFGFIIAPLSLRRVDRRCTLRPPLPSGTRCDPIRRW